MNLERLSKLLTVANHDSSADAERTMAAKAVCAMLADEDIQNLFRSKAARPTDRAELPADLSAALDEICRLRETLAWSLNRAYKAEQAERRAKERAKDAQEQRNKLARDVAKLQASLEKAKTKAKKPTPTSACTVPWAEVEIAITEATDGHVSGLGMTALHLGIPVRVLMAWRTVGQLPRHLFVKIASMQPGQKPSRARWTLDEQTMLKSLAHLEPVQIARQIGAKVGRLILESSVVRMAKMLEVKLGTGVPAYPRRPAGRATGRSIKPTGTRAQKTSQNEAA